jgi:glycosyltransferase involved in cell wall biosynthesis
MKRFQPIGVAFVINSLGLGGAEKHTLQLFNWLDMARFRVALAYLKRDETLLPQIAPDRISQVWCADLRAGWDFGGFCRLSKWLRNFDPDVLVCINPYSLFYAQLARMLLKRHVTIFEIFHSSALASGEAKKMRFVYRHFFNRADKVVYVSANQRAMWESRGIRHDRGICIHNGVDVDHFSDHYSEEEKALRRANLGFTSTDFVVGICAELRPEKQHGDLLAAISQLKQEGIPAKCLIIGDGPCRGEVERRILDLDLTSDAVITGFQADVRPFIAACKCLAIVSSRVEAFSLAALEAMSMRKPMVMSDIGGASEQIVSGYNGFLYSPGDVRALVSSLKILTDVDTCDRLGTQARQRVSSLFAAGSMLRSYDALLAGKAKQHDLNSLP